MYGINGYDEDQLKQLLGFNLPEVAQQESYQVQEPPQIAQGLLGDVGVQNQPRNSGEAGDIAKQMAQVDQQMAQPSDDGGLAQRQASTQQLAQQALAQKQEQEKQAGRMLGKLTKMYFMGG